MLARPVRRMPALSLVPLVDVFLILLIFFFVTSSYLHLDMFPLLEEEARPDAAENAVPSNAATRMIRITPDGLFIMGLKELRPEELDPFLERNMSAEQVLYLLPSPRAPVEALVQVMDAARHNALRLRILEVE